VSNTVSAPTAVAVLEHIVRSIVDNPDDVKVNSVDDEEGRRGRTAMSIRTVVRAAAARDGVDVDVDFVDD
jgi:predicted RNA-binding protein YlqC (UPF0109 family)